MEKNRASGRRNLLWTGVFTLLSLNILAVIFILFLLRHIWGEITAYVVYYTRIQVPWLPLVALLTLVVLVYAVMTARAALHRSRAGAKLPKTSLHLILAVLSFIIWNGILGMLIAEAGDQLSITGRRHEPPLVNTEFDEKLYSDAGIAHLVGRDTALFCARGVDLSSLPRNLTFITGPAERGPVPESWRVRPKFINEKGRYEALVELDGPVSLYGTGMIAGPLLRNGEVTQAWNHDSYGYDDRSRQLYQSHPWVLGVRNDGTAFGVLADTSYRCLIDLDDKIRFKTEGRPFAVIVIEGTSPGAVLRGLSRLIGTMPLPPLWSLGYHQCRYSYYPDQRVREIAGTFREKKIPCDTLWLDIHYMNEYRVFTVDRERFPDPKGLNDYLHGRGFRTTWILDPGIKAEEGYFVYDQGRAEGHFVLTEAGEEYRGRWHAGMCAFPDFTRPLTREWWSGLVTDFMENDMDGLWNDMNEPAIFNEPAMTMPAGNRHRGGGSLEPNRHDRYHNLYGLLMARASRKGMERARPGRRPFVLSRANRIGGQRYAAAWTGDNVANWDHLAWSIPMILNLGLSGQPFSGPDIGGFARNATGELFARWIGVGAFFPFSRGHTQNITLPQEPWAFGPEVEAVSRTALERRYRLLPYIYTLFRESSVTGLPVMRPVFFADPDDLSLREEDRAFLLGGDILVVPRVTRRGTESPALPSGTWRPFTLAGENPAVQIHHPEIRIRGGAIVPIGRIVQSTAEPVLKPLTLLVCLDGRGNASGALYHDRGDGFGYEGGEYVLVTFSARRAGNRVTVREESRQGRMSLPAGDVRVEVITANGVKKGTGTTGQGIVVDLN